MKHRSGVLLCAALLVASGIAMAQTVAAVGPTASAKAFEVATIKASPPIDAQKMMAEAQAGRMPKIGPHITDTQAEYNYWPMRELIAIAYKVKAYQVTGPDWIATQRFDIVARFPEGASKDDVPEMLRALLEERFKLSASKSTQEHGVLGLVTAKGGAKMKEAAAPAGPLDEAAPLKPGEMKMDTPEGPARMSRNKDGSMTMNMGAKGTFIQKMDMQTQSLHLDASSITMQGFAEMLTQMMQMGGGGGRQVVDMTGLKGNYEASVEVPLADLMANARAQGMDIPGPRPGGGGPGPGGGGGGGGGGTTDAAASLGAPEPSGGSTISNSLQKLGLKLEPRKAPVEQVVVEHVEKTPTEN